MSAWDFFKNFSDGFKSIAGSAENGFHRRVREIEIIVTRAFLRLKRKVFRGLFEMLFFSIGVVFAFVGFTLLLSKYFTLDLVIIGFSVLAFYIGFMLRIMK